MAKGDRFVWHSLSEHVQDRVVQLWLSGGGGGWVGQDGRVGGPQLVVHLGRGEGERRMERAGVRRMGGGVKRNGERMERGVGKEGERRMKRGGKDGDGESGA